MDILDKNMIKQNIFYILKQLMIRKDLNHKKNIMIVKIITHHFIRRIKVNQIQHKKFNEISN